MRHASPERGGGREADEGGLGEREAKRSLPQLASAVPTLNPQGNLRIRRIRELKFMVPEFVARTGGSQCVQAQPALEKLKRAGLPWGQRCAIILE